MNLYAQIQNWRSYGPYINGQLVVKCYLFVSARDQGWIAFIHNFLSDGVHF